MLRLRTWHALLPSRGVLSLSGRDARKLLQGLVTGHVGELDEGPQHVAFLGSNGRMLHDAFLVADADGGVLIESEAAAIPALTDHLKRYKLRSKVSLRDRTDELAVVAICGEDAASAAVSSEAGAVVWADPRLAALGCRQLLPRSAVAAAASALPPQASPELYGLLTMVLGLGDGARDMPTGEALPHESNLELLGSISFNKGCYLGQELTARTQFRGAVRKRLLPVVRSEAARRTATEADCVPALSCLPAAERRLAAQLLPPDSDELPAGGAAETAGVSLGSGGGGASLAKLRSFAPGWGVGLALCRLQALEGGTLIDGRDGTELVPHRPSWWPESVGVPS